MRKIDEDNINMWYNWQTEPRFSWCRRVLPYPFRNLKNTFKLITIFNFISLKIWIIFFKFMISPHSPRVYESWKRGTYSLPLILTIHITIICPSKINLFSSSLFTQTRVGPDQDQGRTGKGVRNSRVCWWCNVVVVLPWPHTRHHWLDHPLEVRWQYYKYSCNQENKLRRTYLPNLEHCFIGALVCHPSKFKFNIHVRIDLI